MLFIYNLGSGNKGEPSAKLLTEPEGSTPPTRP